MKQNDKKVITSSSKAELVKKAKDVQNQMRAEYMKRITGEVKNVHSMRTLRHQLAIIKTVLQQKKFEESAK